VIAIGNPFGLGQTATSGIVSALGRGGLKVGGYEDFIQTDASINPGNSGGALVDLQGNLVGINSAILSPAGGNIGIGFAVPSNMAHAVMEQLVSYGQVRRGRLGVVVQDVTPDMTESLDLKTAQGALVTQVESGSPAERSGIRSGDVIIAVDGQVVTSASDLRNRLGLVPLGERVEVDLMRRGRPLSVSASVGGQARRR
jgi:S1-C subfamily serine protease